MPFEFEQQNIEDIILIIPKKFGDNRGFFLESYKRSDFVANGIEENFVQVVEQLFEDGLHRLDVALFRGADEVVVRRVDQRQQLLGRRIAHERVHVVVEDLAVDLRKNSKTFKKYIRVELNEENANMLYIPQGFAHGFVTLSPEAEICYKTSSEYNPNSDRGILWNDNELNIDWGINFVPLLSEKDSNQPKFCQINLEEIA